MKAQAVILSIILGFVAILFGAYFVGMDDQWIVPNQDMVCITLGACLVGLGILISTDK